MEPVNAVLPEPDFDDTHFEDCLAPEGEGRCSCDVIEREIREDFAMARYDLERGN